jgi:hypothetical protein
VSETDIPQYRDVGTINRLRDQKTESPSSTHPWIRAGARLVSATRGKDQAPASLHKAVYAGTPGVSETVISREP